MGIIRISCCKNDPVLRQRKMFFFLFSGNQCWPNTVGVSDPECIRIQWGPWVRIRIQKGKKYPQIYKKANKFNFLSAGCSEGFSWSLDVLY
jgi:hypothetical protein